MILQRFIPREIGSTGNRGWFDPGFGIFGKLMSDENETICFTLEHAYASKIVGESYKPKLPEGQYNCLRGIHKLEKPHSDGLIALETFEIMDVPGHTGILFHIGNTQTDSDGCILLGTRCMKYAITDSREAFEKFMHIQKDVDQFKLTVIRELKNGTESRSV